MELVGLGLITVVNITYVLIGHCVFGPSVEVASQVIL